MAHARFFAAAAALAAAAFVVAARIDPTIMWPNCDGPADHPTIGRGNYYNLCVQGHDFEKEKFAYTFTRTTISESTFTGCTFINKPEKKMNLTGASWSNVKFTDTTFSSLTEDPVVFDYTTFQDVEFNGCVFDIRPVLFTNFAMKNVSFIDCQFRGDTKFELGEMTDVYFNNTSFKRSKDAKTVSGRDRVTFSGVTMRKTYFTADDFITPIIFEAAAVSDLHFNDTNIGEFWCHEPPKRRGDEPKLFASFNDTIFYNVGFRDNFNCKSTTWKGMYIGDSRFERDALFASSTILDIYWDTVIQKPRDKECQLMDFKDSVVTRKVFANVTASCKADFTGSEWEKVFIKNFNAAQPTFKGTIFTNQEYIDGQCCTNACVNLGCKCNTTEVSGLCPVGSSTVNLKSDAVCFPGRATVSLAHGPVVRLADLHHGASVHAGGVHHSDVFMFGHRDPAALTSYVRIDAGLSGHSPLLISPRHYLYVNGRLATAETVSVGDRLRAADGMDSAMVRAVSREAHMGAYAPTTMLGELVVNGVVVSSYTNVMHPTTAHFLLKPFRALYATPLRSVVERVTSVMHTRSWTGLANRLLEEGPDSL